MLFECKYCVEVVVEWFGVLEVEVGWYEVVVVYLLGMVVVCVVVGVCELLVCWIDDVGVYGVV